MDDTSIDPIKSRKKVDISTTAHKDPRQYTEVNMMQEKEVTKRTRTRKKKSKEKGKTKD